MTVSRTVGTEKPLAYQGKRNVMLSFLVYSYDIFKKDNPIPYLEHAAELRRLFTSEMMKILPPSQYNKIVKKHTGMEINPDLSLDDYLNGSATNVRQYFRINRISK